MPYYTSVWGACGMRGPAVEVWWHGAGQSHFASIIGTDPVPLSEALEEVCGEEPAPRANTGDAESTLWFWLGFFGMNSPKPGSLIFLLTLSFRLTPCTPALSLLPNPFYPFPLPSCDCLSISLIFLLWLWHPSLCPASIWSSRYLLRKRYTHVLTQTFSPKGTLFY